MAMGLAFEILIKLVQKALKERGIDKMLEEVQRDDNREKDANYLKRK
jgi:hypothetical protein